MAFFILTRFVLVKYSRAFVERPSQGTSSLALRLSTVSLDTYRVTAGKRESLYWLIPIIDFSSINYWLCVSSLLWLDIPQ